jgi:uncharacterized membrane protein
MNTPPITKARLEALTDGIFAVTMTLLVLDLRFPQPSPTGSVVDDLRLFVDRTDNYVVSFVVLAVFWVGHVRLLRRMRDADTSFAAINLAFLLFTTLVPPLTAVLGDHPALPRAAVLYGGNLLTILVCEVLLWHRVCHRLANEAFENPLGTWRLVRRRYALAIGVVVAGIAAALVEIMIGASVGLAPWVYLLLIGAGIVRPPLRGVERA